ncbi:hypothetical protein ACQ4PT_049785 [Festuca glaucescens]
MARAALLLFFFFFLATVAQTPAPALAAAAACEPEPCGNLTIWPPFGVVSRGAPEENRCAQMGFQVHCTADVPYLGYYEPDYGLQILDIFYGNASLRVSDVHKLGDFLSNGSGDGRPCHVPKASTASKIAAPFLISGLNRNLVFYNCTEAPPSPSTVRREGLVDTVCRNNTFVRAGGRYGELVDYGIEGCDDTALTVRGAAAGEVDPGDYLELISDGFLLTWQPPPAAAAAAVQSPVPLPIPSPTMPLSLLLPLLAAASFLRLPPPAGAACSPRRCGNLTVSYPFWLEEPGQQPCGSPSFQLRCNGTQALLSRSMFGLYQVLEIFTDNSSFVAVDHNLPLDDGCLPRWFNISLGLGLSPFVISKHNSELLVLYNCTDERQRPAPPGFLRMPCGDESYVHHGGEYGAHHDYPGNLPTACRLSPSCRFLGSPPAAAGFGAGGAGLLMGFFAYFVWHKHKKRKQARTSSDLMRSGSSMNSYSKDLELGGSPHIFTFEELEEATDGFCASRELGDGGFGTVYKGKLKDGRVVAVKRLYKNNYKRVEQFLNEVDILSRLLHQNLVILYGCTSRMSRDLLLVYEFIPNGTVADHLHGSRVAERGLTWPLRLNIAIETAEALAYLHAVEIIHRDVKTTNILLDNSFHVKVADFGLSRLFPLEVTHVSTVPQGTPGYVDPVYHQCYKLTDKSDVYSFGVVLVELISSKPAVDMSRSHSEINLANMALNRIQNHEVVQLVDPGLGYDTDSETKGSIDRVAEVAFQCLQLERELRPSIKEVVEILNCIRDGDCPSKKMGKDASLKEDTHLLRGSLQFSPDSVIHRFHSQSTNHSVASNGSGV